MYYKYGLQRKCYPIFICWVNYSFNIFASPYISTCGVKDVQSMEAVSRPLNEGIVSICKICESLKKAHISPNTDTCSNYNQIRKHIEDAEQCLKTSETMIKEKLGYLDESMEQLIREKQNVEQQKKEKSLAMDNLCLKKKSAEESLEHSKAALEQAERSVESANYAIRAHQDRMNTCNDVATAGAALLAIPIIGWIAGEYYITLTITLNLTVCEVMHFFFLCLMCIQEISVL